MLQLETEQRSLRATKVSIPERLHNQMYLVSLDLSLEGMWGLSFRDFVVEFPVKALEPFEKRVLVPDAECGGVRCPHDPPGRMRSVIVDERSGELRFELAVTLDSCGNTRRRSLHTCGDEGPIGRPTREFMYEDLKMRGTRSRDRCHKIPNAVKGAQVASGVWILTLENVVVENIVHGSWESDNVYQSMKDNVIRWHASETAENELFQFFYPWHCRVNGIVGPEFGTKHHQEEVWKMLPKLPVLESKRAFVRVGRWFKAQDAIMDNFAERPLFCMCLVILGIAKGYWTTLWGSPLFQRTGSLEIFDLDGGAAPASSTVAEELPTTMKQSNQMFRASRDACPQSIKFVVGLLADGFREKMTRGVGLLTEPVRIDFGLRNVSDRTQLGAVKNAVELASGDANLVLYKIFDTFFSEKFANDVGCLLQTKLSGEQLEAKRTEDERVADVLFGYTWRLAKGFHSVNLEYSQSLPGLFALLLSADASVREAGLNASKELWQLRELLQAIKCIWCSV